MTPDAIRARLDAYAAEDPADGDYGDFRRDYAAPEAIAALRAVLDLHKPYRIYTECGHDHPVNDETGEPTEPDVILANEIGAVCQDGYLYTICRECCLDNGDEQREECADGHDHAAGDPLCATVRIVAAALGVAEPAQPPVPAQAEPRVWRVTAVPDGIDTAEIGTLHRERDGRWESWYDDGDGDDADWYPSAWTGKARMEHYGYTLAEVTDQAGEA